MPRRTAGRSPSVPPSSSAHPPQPADEEEETALAISDQRTLYLVNIFIGNAARFLNNFADLCQDKLADVHRRILRLDASLTLLEAKLRNTCPKQEFEDDNGFKTMGSPSQSILSNLLPLDNSLYPPCVSGESSSINNNSIHNKSINHLHWLLLANQQPLKILTDQSKHLRAPVRAFCKKNLQWLVPFPWLSAKQLHQDADKNPLPCVADAKLKKKGVEFDLLKEVDALRRAKNLRVVESKGGTVRKWSARDFATMVFIALSFAVLGLTRFVLCD